LKQLTVAKRKAQLRDHYRRLQAEALSSARKDKSKVLNEERIRRLRHQDSKLTELGELAKQRLAKFASSGGPDYAALLPRLVGQAMAQIAGRGAPVDEVLVRVRAADVALLTDGKPSAGTAAPLKKSLVAAVGEAFTDTLRREAELSARARAEAEAETGAAAAAAAVAAAEARVLPGTILVREDRRLEEGKGRVGGGVVVSAAEDRIIVDNSLQARIGLVTHELQHVVRAALFPREADA